MNTTETQSDTEVEDNPSETTEEFIRKIRLNGDQAVNIHTSPMLKSIVRGIIRDFASGFKPGSKG